MILLLYFRSTKRNFPNIQHNNDSSLAFVHLWCSFLFKTSWYEKRRCWICRACIWIASAVKWICPERKSGGKRTFGVPFITCLKSRHTFCPSLSFVWCNIWTWNIKSNLGFMDYIISFRLFLSDEGFLITRGGSRKSSNGKVGVYKIFWTK